MSVSDRSEQVATLRMELFASEAKLNMLEELLAKTRPIVESARREYYKFIQDETHTQTQRDLLAAKVQMVEVKYREVEQQVQQFTQVHERLERLIEATIAQLPD